ncbi:MAG: hypothetical protein ACFCUT_02390 [Kiloniellaceae bacterium]
MSDAERSTRKRRNRNLGLRCYRVALPEFDLAERLIDRGYVTEEQSADIGAVQEALQRILAEWIKKTATRGAERVGQRCRLCQSNGESTRWNCRKS